MLDGQSSLNPLTISIRIMIRIFCIYSQIVQRSLVSIFLIKAVEKIKNIMCMYKYSVKECNIFNKQGNVIKSFEYDRY